MSRKDEPAEPKPHRPATWLGVAADACLLGAEATMVVALRLARLAGGGEGAKREARRMVREKLHAHCTLVQEYRGGSLGTTAPAIAGNTVRHYLRFVRANRTRLGRGKSRKRIAKT